MNFGARKNIYANEREKALYNAFKRLKYRYCRRSDGDRVRADNQYENTKRRACICGLYGHER